jgi:hypothetical protein
MIGKISTPDERNSQSCWPERTRQLLGILQSHPVIALRTARWPSPNQRKENRVKHESEETRETFTVCDLQNESELVTGQRDPASGQKALATGTPSLRVNLVPPSTARLAKPLFFKGFRRRGMTVFSRGG